MSNKEGLETIGNMVKHIAQMEKRIKGIGKICKNQSLYLQLILAMMCQNKIKK